MKMGNRDRKWLEKLHGQRIHLSCSQAASFPGTRAWERGKLSQGQLVTHGIIVYELNQGQLVTHDILCTS